jgi:hypothetical protein
MDIRKVVIALVASSVLVAGATGCATAPGGIAPSNIPIEGRKFRVLGDVRATDSNIWLFGVIPVSGANNVRTALDKAIRKKQADALINITVDAYDQWWILFTRRATSVHGQAIKFE